MKPRRGRMEKIKPCNYQEREHRYRRSSDFKFLLLHAELRQIIQSVLSCPHPQRGWRGRDAAIESRRVTYEQQWAQSSAQDKQTPKPSPTRIQLGKIREGKVCYHGEKRRGRTNRKGGDVRHREELKMNATFFQDLGRVSHT